MFVLFQTPSYFNFTHRILLETASLGHCICDIQPANGVRRRPGHRAGASRGSCRPPDRRGAARRPDTAAGGCGLRRRSTGRWAAIPRCSGTGPALSHPKRLMNGPHSCELHAGPLGTRRGQTRHTSKPGATPLVPITIDRLPLDRAESCRKASRWGCPAACG